MQLVNWYSKQAGVKALGDAGVIKRTTRESESWEHPRPPFEVSPCLFSSCTFHPPAALLRALHHTEKQLELLQTDQNAKMQTAAAST